MMSRVVPAWGETIAASRLAIRLSKVDFPAFGGPAIATTRPSRSLSPRPPSANTDAISSPSARAICSAGVTGPGERLLHRKNQFALQPTPTPGSTALASFRHDCPVRLASGEMRGDADSPSPPTPDRQDLQQP